LQSEQENCKEKLAADDVTIQSMQNQMNGDNVSSADNARKSKMSLGLKDAYIRQLQESIAHKDSIALVLVNNLRNALGSNADINITIEKGVVYVDISDHLLFSSGKYAVTEMAKEALGKIATVFQDQPQIQFLVEGRTDNAPYKDGLLLDNWDLSVKRATAVVRIFQNVYHILPSRMTAAGRSEYVPMASNDTKDGKAANRITRIMILPELDQFFKLLEQPGN